MAKQVFSHGLQGPSEILSHYSELIRIMGKINYPKFTEIHYFDPIRDDDFAPHIRNQYAEMIYQISNLNTIIAVEFPVLSPEKRNIKREKFMSSMGFVNVSDSKLLQYSDDINIDLYLLDNRFSMKLVWSLKEGEIKNQCKMIGEYGYYTIIQAGSALNGPIYSPSEIYVDYEEAYKVVHENTICNSYLPVICPILLITPRKKPEDWDFSGCSKYYSEKLDVIRTFIGHLYDLPGCLSGGLGHVTIDEENLDDETIDATIAECDKEENKDKVERHLVKMICEMIKDLSLQERALLVTEYHSLGCHNDCENCFIRQGKYKEVNYHE